MFKEASSAIAELYILNLPVGKDVSQIKTRLHKLSDNCGGKVTSVTGRTAVMKFPNHQSAARYCLRYQHLSNSLSVQTYAGYVLLMKIRYW